MLTQWVLSWMCRTVAVWARGNIVIQRSHSLLADCRVRCGSKHEVGTLLCMCLSASAVCGGCGIDADARLQKRVALHTNMLREGCTHIHLGYEENTDRQLKQIIHVAQQEQLRIETVFLMKCDGLTEPSVLDTLFVLAGTI